MAIWTENEIQVHKYQNVWYRIFRNDLWLEHVSNKGHRPLLIGHDLDKLYSQTPQPYVFHLVMTCYPRLRMDAQDLELFHRALKPAYEISGRGGEMTIEGMADDPLIVLNICDLKGGWDFEFRAAKYFDPSNELLRSTYMYWGDVRQGPQLLKANEIIGIGPEKNRKSISSVCWAYLKDPEGKDDWLCKLLRGAEENFCEVLGADGRKIERLEWV
jgi:hypothetical protein